MAMNIWILKKKNGKRWKLESVVDVSAVNNLQVGNLKNNLEFKFLCLRWKEAELSMFVCVAKC